MKKKEKDKMRALDNIIQYSMKALIFQKYEKYIVFDRD